MATLKSFEAVNREDREVRRGDGGEVNEGGILQNTLRSQRKKHCNTGRMRG
jgi:hypothetical protein